MHDRTGGVAAALGREHYRGGTFGWVFLVFMGAMNLFRGSIHTFADDGGAGRIAGIDLSEGGDVIIMLFATMGVTQLLMAGIDFAVALRFRALTPMVLAYHGVQTAASAAVIWLYKPLPVPAPGKFGALVMLPLIGLALWASLRPRAIAAAEPAAGAASSPTR